VRATFVLDFLERACRPKFFMMAVAERRSGLFEAEIVSAACRKKE